MQYQPFHETLESTTLGADVTALLPKGYVECDQLLRDAAFAFEVPSDESEAIYSRFCDEL